MVDKLMIEDTVFFVKFSPKEYQPNFKMTRYKDFIQSIREYLYSFTTI